MDKIVMLHSKTLRSAYRQEFGKLKEGLTGQEILASLEIPVLVSYRTPRGYTHGVLAEDAERIRALASKWESRSVVENPKQESLNLPAPKSESQEIMPWIQYIHGFLKEINARGSAGYEGINRRLERVEECLSALCHVWGVPGFDKPEGEK